MVLRTPRVLRHVIGRLKREQRLLAEAPLTGHREISSTRIPIVRRRGGGIFRGFICHSSHRSSQSRSRTKEAKCTEREWEEKERRKAEGGLGERMAESN